MGSEKIRKNSEIKNKVSVAGRSVIGKGRTAAVYDMGDGKVMKLFDPSVPFESIRQEYVLTQLAHEKGIPAVNAYEIVMNGERYGIMMEKLKGVELEAFIKEHPDKRNELINRFAGFVRKLHQIDNHDERMRDIREYSISLTEQLDPSFCSKDEVEKIRAVFECIPSATTFVHGDCHPGNVMIAGDEMQLIDMMLCGKGHPVFDLLCMYSHYVFLPSFITDDDCISRFGVDKKQLESLYDSFLIAYFDKSEDQDIFDGKVRDMADIKEQIRGVHAARLCLASVVMPGAFPDEVLIVSKNRAVRFAEMYCSKE